MIKIIAISGSLRSGSLNTLLLKAIQQYAPPDCEIELASIKDIPLYNNDVEQNSGLPESVVALKNKIVECDGLLISTPEYNNGIPGVLKNALDWLSRPTNDVARVFGQRNIGIIGASPSRLGTAFAQTAWLPILRYLNTRSYFGHSLLISSAHTVFNQQGDISDDKTQQLVKNYIDGYIDFINHQ